jgi:hypothetical protein
VRLMRAGSVETIRQPEWWPVPTGVAHHLRLCFPAKRAYPPGKQALRSRVIGAVINRSLCPADAERLARALE